MSANTREFGIAVLKPLSMAQAKGLIKFRAYPFAKSNHHLVFVRVEFLAHVPKEQKEKFDQYIKENYDTKKNTFRGSDDQFYEFEFLDIGVSN